MPLCLELYQAIKAVDHSTPVSDYMYSQLVPVGSISVIGVVLSGYIYTSKHSPFTSVCGR